MRVNPNETRGKMKRKTVEKDGKVKERKKLSLTGTGMQDGRQAMESVFQNGVMIVFDDSLVKLILLLERTLNLKQQSVKLCPVGRILGESSVLSSHGVLAIVSRILVPRGRVTNLLKVIELIPAVLTVPRFRVSSSVLFLLLAIATIITATLRANSFRLICVVLKAVAVLFGNSRLGRMALMIGGRDIVRTLRSSHGSWDDIASALFQNLSLQPVDFLAQSCFCPWGGCGGRDHLRTDCGCDIRRLDTGGCGLTTSVERSSAREVRRNETL